MLVGTKDFNGDGKADCWGACGTAACGSTPGGTGAYGADARSVTSAGTASTPSRRWRLQRRRQERPRSRSMTVPVAVRRDGPRGCGSNGYSRRPDRQIRLGRVQRHYRGPATWDRDGKNDSPCPWQGGSLWLYRGTGVVNASNSGYLPRGEDRRFGWEVFDQIFGVGDFNSDGNNDVLARRPDGTLWFYAGDGTGKLLPSRRIGTGWNIFDRVVCRLEPRRRPGPDLVARRPDGSLGATPEPHETQPGLPGKAFAGSL